MRAAVISAVGTEPALGELPDPDPEALCGAGVAGRQSLRAGPRTRLR